ncbi:thiamine pyrophosphate-requiring protein [Scleromatobacter humisilvae]|uniref:Thiamine pyrophosphate-requiring protein n=1 Tax=Scleromatobacter humisilvae TaxID=2897159 RepID=A0A9X1YP64_9BURK|nr:thiamine pyrophosphate-requiring protein [Scleromatobacter humisilvae]MCK9689681.1 thiamine pyrophosphate-requiring protein [Scleromatobacter humisilvae]
MAKTVSDQLIARLVEWGVQRVYGYPGDGINGVMGALRRAQDQVAFVQTQHEELAAFMAAAHPKFTGEVGVCIATSGPGAIHLLNGLYDAKADHQPVLAIVGQQARSALGGDFQQEVDLVSLFKDVAHEYVQMATVPEQILHLVDRAMRIARDRRAVTCLILPNDLQELAAVEPPREHAMMHTGIGYTSPEHAPRDLDLVAAAAVLNEGRKIAILAGAGALHATDELIAIADRLGAGIAKALLGKMAVPDDLPNVTGSIGLLGTAPSWKMMEDCDTLLMVGSSFPYSEFLPKPGQARGVQVDIEPRQLGLRYPMEINLVGDAKLTLQALLPLLKTNPDRSWRDTIESNVRDWWRVLESRAMTDAKPINPQRVFWELSPRLPDDAILTADSGTVASWYARDIKARRGMMGTLSGGLATMGPAVPYALTAKMAYPDRPVIALVGDGAMQMLGINGLITIAREWRKWKDPRLVVMVLNNGDLNMVTWEQRSTEGDPKFEGSQDVPSFPYAQYGRMLGLGGVRVEQPADIAGAWDEALASDRPMVLEMVTDPTVPPAPPHITAKQVRHYAAALLQGDAQALQVVRSSAREWWDGLVRTKT